MPATTSDLSARPSSRLTWAGVFFGLALAGFFDGIVLHQILQWHHLLSSVDDPAVRDDITLNTLADGLFHAAAYVFLLIGLVLLWRARRDFGALRLGRSFTGAVLVGAGAFNLVEGLVNHHLLGIHHVRTGSPNELLWDLAFLGLGLALALAGFALMRPARA